MAREPSTDADLAPAVVASAAAKADNSTLLNIDESELQEDTLHVADEPGDDPQSSSVPLNDVPPQTPPHKTSILHFPTLPAPSPLRKSVRAAREPSTDADLASAVVAPAQPPVLGKRTSWLTKAREVKAMEGVIPGRTSALGSGPGSIATSSHTIIPSNGVKRKSSDMLSAASSTSDKSDEGRRAKVAKASESDSAPENLTQAPPFVLGLTKVTEEHLEPLNDNEDEASFMGVFKRTVEGLGARVGKSMGKSLGGGAATAALAEARAAAEARVAERNKIPGEEVTESEEDFTARVEEPQLTAEHIRQPRESERRLSLSDLAPNQLGTSKKVKPEVKSLQLAAAAAKKVSRLDLLGVFRKIKVLCSRKRKPTRRPPVSKRWKLGARQHLLARQKKTRHALLKRRRRSERNPRSANVSATRPRKSALSRQLLRLRRSRKIR